MSVLLHIVDDECFADAVTNIARGAKPGGVFVAIDPVVTHAFWGRESPRLTTGGPEASLYGVRNSSAMGLSWSHWRPSRYCSPTWLILGGAFPLVGLDLYWRLFVKLMLLSGVAERVSAHAAAAADRMALRVLTHGPSTKCLVARKLPV